VQCREDAADAGNTTFLSLTGDQLRLAGRVPQVCTDCVTRRIRCEFHVKKRIAKRSAAPKAPPNAALRKTLTCSGIRTRCEARAAAPVQFSGSNEHLKPGGFPRKANLCLLAEKSAKKWQGEG